MKPGIYPAMTMDEYLAIKAINASLVCDLVTSCPEKAWFNSAFNPEPKAPDDTDGSDAGTLAHALLLEGNDSLVEVIDPLMYQTKGSGNIPTHLTQNKEIRAARDLAREQGRIPMLKAKYDVVQRMTASARSKIERVKAKQPALWDAFQPNGGYSETTVIFEVDGMPCKMRPDRMNATRTMIVDAKFTGMSAEPNNYGRTQLIRMNYYIGAAFYRLGLGGSDNISYTYLITEDDEPYLSSWVGVTPQLFDIGMQKVEWALRRWKQCMERGRFEGYADDICYPDTPPWVEAQWLDQQTSNDDGIAYGSQP